MFYKALGFAVWKLAMAYLRQRLSRPIRVAAALGLISIAVGGYLATRSSE